MAITFVITNAGRNALVNAANTGTASVMIAQAGLSSAAVAPSPTTANLPGEFKRIGTLSGDIVADDTIHLIVRDESSDVFTLRSIALYLADGTLFGIYGQSEILLEKSSQALMLLAVDIRFEDVAAGNISFGNANFLNPPATTDRQGVVELATITEARAGVDTQRAITPAAARQSVRDWIGYTPVNRAGDVMTGPLSIERVGSPSLSVISTGVIASTLVAQSDGNIVFYRNSGLGETAVWHAGISGQFDINMPITRQSNRVWDAGNDGAGSGLDADLLDGQEGGYYANIPARLGYTPVNRAGDVMTGPLSIERAGAATLSVTSVGVIASSLVAQPDGNIVFYRNSGLGETAVWHAGISGQFDINMPITRQSNRVWDAGNDGAGSGLDADLLDGQEGGYYTNITARLGYTPIQQGTGVGQALTNAVKIGWDAATGTFLKCTVDDYDLGKFVFAPNLNVGELDINGASMRRNGSHVWGPDNDGSGSGLDADLLDGQNSGYFTNIPARLGYAPVSKAGDTMSGPLQLSYYGSPSLDLNSAGVAIGRLAMQDDGALVLYRDDGAGPKPVFSIPSQTDPFNVQRTITRQGFRVWDAGNDGSGSGLDADLLDGQDSGYFTDIPARLGYAPVSKAGDTMSGPLQLSYYGSPSLDLNSAGVAIGRLAMQDDGALVLYRDDGAGPKPVFSIPSQTDPFNVQRTITRQGFRVWDAGNDGSGSGMDADFLDGQDGSFYTNISARLGYIPLNAATYVAADILAKLSTVDGSGSGLDADLLDGREGGYYTDIPSRLGYAPVSKGGDTMSGPLDIVYPGAALTLNSPSVAVGRLAMQGDGSLVLYRDDGAGQKPIYSIPSQTDPFNVHRTITRLGNLVWDAGNDGAGSGMDADMLDGHDGAFYADITARLGFTPIQQGTGTGQNGNVVKIGWNNSSRLSCTVDAYDVGNFVFDANLNNGEQAVNGAYMRRNGYHLWGPENDGSGSGLDADLLDGLQSSDFTRVVSQNMAAVDGYRVFADGTKECWTRLSIGQHQYATWNLPVPHTSFVHPSLGCSTAGGNAEVQDNTGITSINGVESITFWNADDRTITVWVRTIGR